MTKAENFETFHLLMVIILVSALIVTIINLLPVSWGSLITDINSLSPIISSLLSGLLVLLYFMQYNSQKEHTKIVDRQSRIQKQQTELMQKQTEWMEQNHVPDLSIDNWRIKNQHLQSSLDISNFGKGIARKLNLCMEFRYLKKPLREQVEDGEELTVTSLDNLPLEYRNIRIPFKLNRSDVTVDGKSASIIEAKESQITFNCEGRERIQYEEDKGGSLSSVGVSEFFSELSECQVDQVWYIFNIEYQYANNREGSIELWGGYAPPDEIENLIDLIDHADHLYNPYHLIQLEIKVEGVEVNEYA
ncbi:hypothetical protein [Haloplanus rubicundus]|uniref:hypothetical protein n=1 Tax=Haloplanus rubicundus TaxID=1547898 RepID=UPI0013001803|nr:hypothetical protein [Haloplanus rubicundus]